jgi:predicted nucleic acid-binding Zn ribbon protein
VYSVYPILYGSDGDYVVATLIEYMDYTLAKKLKDAGFVQKGKGYIERWDFAQDEPLYIPTLSELIDACGERFEELNKIGHGIKPKWNAASYSCEECGWDGMEVGRGLTKEEAVANLWLAINK